MLGHMIEQLRPKPAASARRVAEGSACAARTRDEIAPSVKDLNVLSRRGLWGIILFLVLSAVTLWLSVSGLLSELPVDLREIFGDAPPAELVHLALGVSWLSALILILGRMTGDATPGYNWYNIGLPAAFYPLYVFTDSSGSHFPLVFAAGLVLLLVEHWSVVRYIRQERVRIGQLPE